MIDERRFQITGGRATAWHRVGWSNETVIYAECGRRAEPGWVRWDYEVDPYSADCSRCARVLASRDPVSEVRG